MRYALGIEYDGAEFFGWQRQRHAPSLQQSVEKALAVVANHPVTVICAGRMGEFRAYNIMRLAYNRWVKRTKLFKGTKIIASHDIDIDVVALYQ